MTEIRLNGHQKIRVWFLPRQPKRAIPLSDSVNEAALRRCRRRSQKRCHRFEKRSCWESRQERTSIFCFRSTIHK